MLKMLTGIIIVGWTLSCVYTIYAFIVKDPNLDNIITHFMLLTIILLIHLHNNKEGE